ncbi:cobyrinic acid a,c-diamide synthase [Opitutaceae bacterium EW11]|nr:cobyrinic acid a,c-diamide synthase [Opitutaceae bacterium EW11]
MPQNLHSIPRLVVAGTASGVGKTTVTSGLIAALRRRGLVVQPFKCGPDYIDPSYHTRAAGRPCRNLDSWMLDDQGVRETFVRGCEGADIAIVEGVMGLFDGCDYLDERASAAQIAKLLGAPVLLVAEISGAARSAAALVSGFVSFDPGVRIAGVVLNLAGSESHARGCASAIQRHGGPPMVGWLPRQKPLSIPERHLGLVGAGEQGGHPELIDHLATAVEQRFDLDAVIQLARGADPMESITAATPASAAGERPLLAVARDEAFCFYYPENLDLLEAAGARIAWFSPVQGDRLPAGAAGVYLGGGYPELHAPALAANDGLWNDLRALHRRGAPILAECGGFMALAEALIDQEGQRWPMAGLVPGVTRMRRDLVALGYRHATALGSNLLAEAGETLRGHEFHYSSWETSVSEETGAAWRIRGLRPDDPGQLAGFTKNGLLASYLHLHLGQRPDLAPRFVSALARSGSM